MVRFVDDAQYGNNRLPVVPRHMLRAEARIGNDDWHLSPSVEWVPQGAWVDYSKTSRDGGYATAGVTGSVRVAGATEVFVVARNLANRKAVGDISAVVKYAFDNPATAADESSSIFSPIERRAVFVGIRTAIGAG